MGTSAITDGVGRAAGRKAGETVASEVHAMAAALILMLTAKSAQEERIRGLELGADDHVIKPFSPRELVLRVQAIRYELINRVCGYEFEGYEPTVDSHVKNLHRKIEEDPASLRIIQTVLGGGTRCA